MELGDIEEVNVMLKSKKLESDMVAIIKKQLEKKIDIEFRDVYTGGICDEVYVLLKVSKKKRQP